MASSMEAIQKILQETVAPGISDIRERLARVEVEIKRLDDKVDSFRNETASEFRRLDNRIDSLDRRLDESTSIRERLAALEARMASH